MSDMDFVKNYLCKEIKVTRIFEYHGQEEKEWDNSHANIYQRKKKKEQEKEK